MYCTIQKWGNSQAVRLPKAILELAQFGENENVAISVENNKIVIEKKAGVQHRTLKERLTGFAGEYTFEEWNTGAPVGSEVL